MRTFHFCMTPNDLRDNNHTKNSFQELVWDTVNRYNLAEENVTRHIYSASTLVDQDGNEYSNFLGIVAATYDQDGWPHLQFVTGDVFSSEVLWIEDEEDSDSDNNQDILDKE